MKNNQLPKFNTPLHFACSVDWYHQTLNYIHFQDGWAHASDAHIMAFCKLSNFGFSDEQISMLNGKSIHRKQYAQVYKKTVKVNTEGIYLPEYDCTFMLKDIKEFDSTNGQSVVQWMKNAIEKKLKKRSIFKIAMNTDLLKTLSACIGSNQVVLEFDTISKPIKVTDRLKKNEHYGYIMPISLEM